MSNLPTSPVTTPAATSSTSTGDALRCSAKPSKLRTVVATLGAAAGLAVLTTTFAGVGQAQASVRPLPVVTAHPGSIVTPSGAVRCTKPGQLHVTVPVRTTKTLNGQHKAALYLQYHYGQQRTTLIGRASSKSATVPVIGCLDPAQIDGNAGPVYLIAVDVVDGGRNIARVRISR